MSRTQAKTQVKPQVKTRAKAQTKTKRADPVRRVGRPPKDLAGDVDQRILDAAQHVFLKRGFGGATIDEIAETAPASKPTIYARFSGKEALFIAVVARVVHGLTDFENYTPVGRTLQEKLINLASAVVDCALKEAVGLLRVTIAESGRFPKLSRDAHHASRDHAQNAVGKLLVDMTRGPTRTAKRAAAGRSAAATAEIFLDLILLPTLMGCLMGADEATVRKELPDFIRERVNVFLAACGPEAG
ncbi:MULTISPECIES: helix-turn-helix domain-containing protein [unclassified Bradyrhizobium]|uniref:TetR/AcrR family transcriptional regulator n=1 Tax=unclassified Bradyrhizobium TaxID=2631580 RepID=UPI0028E96E04|nr:MULTISPECIES: helix-turn-helix domain-containing protein [unclassified Bradyrhizobium]